MSIDLEIENVTLKMRLVETQFEVLKLQHQQLSVELQRLQNFKGIEPKVGEISSDKVSEG